MTITPDPKTVREIARSAYGYLPHDYVRVRLVQAAIAEHGIDEHDIPTWSAYFDAAKADLAGAVVSWPDEQPQAERNPCGVQLPADSAQRLGASPDTRCARPDGHTAHDDGNGVLWIDRERAAQEEQAAIDRNIADLLSDENLDAHRVSASIQSAIRQVRADLAEMTRCRDNAMAYAERQDVPIELDDEIDIDGEELSSRIEGELLGPGWNWEDDRTPGLLAKQAVAVIRPHLARLTDQAQTAREALVEAQDEQDGDARAVADFLASDKLGPAMAALHDHFATRIAALDAGDAKGRDA